MTEASVEPAATTDPASAELLQAQAATAAGGGEGLGHTAQDDSSTAAASSDPDGGTADLAPQGEG